MKRCLSLVPAAALIAALLSPAARADEPTEVQKKTAELEQQTALLNAQNAMLQAKWPVIAGGKEGKLSKESGGVYALGAWAQVYERLGQAAGEICTVLRTAPNRTAQRLVLLTEAELESALRYRVVHQEQAAILAAIDVIAPAAAPGPATAAAPLAAVAAVLPSIISVTKLFRTDIALHDESVTIANGALAELVHACAHQPPAIELAYPAVAGLYALTGAQPTKFGQGTERIIAARTRLQGVIDQKADAAKSVAATALLARGDKFVAELYAAPAAAGRAPVAEVLLGEAVDEAVRGAGGVLFVGIVQQGGNSMVTSSVWHEDRLYVGGGAIVTFKLIEKGHLVAAGTIRKVDPEFREVPLRR